MDFRFSKLFILAGRGAAFCVFYKMLRPLSGGRVGHSQKRECATTTNIEMVLISLRGSNRLMVCLLSAKPGLKTHSEQAEIFSRHQHRSPRIAMNWAARKSQGARQYPGWIGFEWAVLKHLRTCLR